MTIKELKELIKNLPDDMKVITINNYEYYGDEPDYSDVDTAEVTKIWSNYNCEKKKLWEKEIEVFYMS